MPIIKETKKGFTLIELVVVMGLIVICTSLVASLAIPMIKQYKKTVETADYMQKATHVLEQLSDQLVLSEDITFENKTGYQTISLDGNNQVVWIDNNGASFILFDDNYFENLDATLTFSSANDYTLIINIKLSEKGVIKYDNTNYVECINMKLAEKKITPTGSYNTIYFK